MDLFCRSLLWGSSDMSLACVGLISRSRAPTSLLQIVGLLYPI